MAHKDVLGKELAIGDYVVYIVPVDRALGLGRVIEFSPKRFASCTPTVAAKSTL